LSWFKFGNVYNSQMPIGAMASDDSSTEENDESDVVASIYEKTINLRKKTIERKKILGKKSIDEVLIMSSKYDPYYIGSETDIKKAEWAYELWKDYIDTTGVDQVHVRGIHYYIVMKKIGMINPPTKCDWSVYENTINCSSYLGACVEKARYLNLIPPDGIIDEKNNVTVVTVYEPHQTNYAPSSINSPVYIPYSFDLELPKIIKPYDNFEEYLEKAPKRYAENLVNGGSLVGENGIVFSKNLVKPFYKVAWSEKKLPKFIHEVFRRYNFDKVVEGGELSLTMMYDFIKDTNKRKQDGVAFYFSDYDPRGNDMPINMAIKLRYSKDVDLLSYNAYIQPVVLTEEQIIEHNIPLAPIKLTGEKKYDTLKKKFKESQSVDGFAELTALEGDPALYVKIVEDKIKPWLTRSSEINNLINDEKQKLINEIIKITKEEMEQHRDLLQTHYDKITNLANEVIDVLPDYDKIKKQFNHAKEIVHENYSLKEDMERVLSKIQDNITLPDVIPPQIKKEPTVECLYDSRRDFEKQFKILYDSKVTKKKIPSN